MSDYKEKYVIDQISWWPMNSKINLENTPHSRFHQ
jgi:hypothetical protein